MGGQGGGGDKQAGYSSRIYAGPCRPVKQAKQIEPEKRKLAGINNEAQLASIKFPFRKIEPCLVPTLHQGAHTFACLGPVYNLSLLLFFLLREAIEIK